MYTPPDLLGATFDVTTSAGGTLSQIVIPSAGGGFRNRVWSWGAALAHTETGPTGVEAELRQGGSLATHGWGAFRSGGPRECERHYAGGYAFPESVAVQIAIRVTPGAATDVMLWIYYTVEEV